MDALCVGGETEGGRRSDGREEGLLLIDERRVGLVAGETRIVGQRHQSVDAIVEENGVGGRVR